MSDVPAHDVDTGSESEDPETIFARLAEAPLEPLNALMRRVEATYEDLNKIFAHPYWGDLVLHHGTALRALGEAHTAMERFRAEATGAHNTERGITVVTMVRGEEHRHGHTESEYAELLRTAFEWDDQLRVCSFYAWDRPFTDPDEQLPEHHLRLVTFDDWAVVTFSRESDDGELHTWHAVPDQPARNPPTVRLAPGSRHKFVPEVVFPLEHAQPVVERYLATATRPETVSWQEPRWL